MCCDGLSVSFAFILSVFLSICMTRPLCMSEIKCDDDNDRNSASQWKCLVLCTVYRQSASTGTCYMYLA